MASLEQRHRDGRVVESAGWKLPDKVTGRAAEARHVAVPVNSVLTAALKSLH